MPDLVHRRSSAVAVDVFWCGDVTEIATDEGRLCPAAVEDLEDPFSRRLLGHAMSAHHDAALTVVSLQMAAVTRGGDVDGVIFHTGRGSEPGLNRPSQHRLPGRLSALGVVQSMSRVGRALDNAPAESFNATLKVEFAYRNRFATRAEARLKIAIWIADFTTYAVVIAPPTGYHRSSTNSGSRPPERPLRRGFSSPPPHGKVSTVSEDCQPACSAKRMARESAMAVITCRASHADGDADPLAVPDPAMLARIAEVASVLLDDRDTLYPQRREQAPEPHLVARLDGGAERVLEVLVVLQQGG